MKPEDVPDEWVDIALDASFAGGAIGRMAWKQAIAAVAPMIAARERGACTVIDRDGCLVPPDAEPKL